MCRIIVVHILLCVNRNPAKKRRRFVLRRDGTMSRQAAVWYNASKGKEVSPLKKVELEFLLCCGIVSFVCPECGKNIKATTDEVLSKETPYKCPHCSSTLDIEESAS